MLLLLHTSEIELPFSSLRRVSVRLRALCEFSPLRHRASPNHIIIIKIKRNKSKRKIPVVEVDDLLVVLLELHVPLEFFHQILIIKGNHCFLNLILTFLLSVTFGNNLICLCKILTLFIKELLFFLQLIKLF